MDPNTLDEEAIFKVACRITEAEARESYLQQICGKDQPLLARVSRLLREYDQQPNFLENDATNVVGTSVLTAMPNPIGSTIGPYKIREELGEGGMGIVYAAEQEHPVRRKVAVKLIKPGMDSREVIGRFEAERQALAMMDHQNIARVLDAGTTKSGLPYFVMELVRGVTVTEYCDKNRLSVRERLELFTQICKAVQHAHQKGIIHRDIKPSNVMITMHDGVPVPKVIDFGVAKAINQRLTEATVYTKVAQVLGTPAYMSPEQAELSGLDIDTRSDIYSLGVMLYELLTGSTPFTKDHLSKASLDEMRRVIRETDPQRPSERVSTLKAEAISTVAKHRSNDQRKLLNLLRGELDWIVMKALEKDRNRRYETANGLAADVQRFLDDEPIVARPPSATYRFRKFAKRNKVGIALSSLAGLVLVAGVVGLVVSNILITRQKDIADQKTFEAQQQKLVADQKTAEAEQESEYATAIADFVSEDFLNLKSVPSQVISNGATVHEMTSNYTFRELLDRAAEKLDTRSDLDPAIGSKLHWMIGDSYRKLSEKRLAIDHLEKSLKFAKAAYGEQHLKTAVKRFFLSIAYQNAWRYDDALPLAKQNVDYFQQNYGAKDANTIANELLVISLNQETGNGKLAIPEFEAFVKKVQAILGPDHNITIGAKRLLADAHKSSNSLQQAVKQREEIVVETESRHGTHHIESVVANLKLAVALNSASEIPRALEVATRAVDVLSQINGPPSTLTDFNAQRFLVQLLRESGESKKAMELIQSGSARVVEVLGEEHIITLLHRHALSGCYADAGELEKASELLRNIIAVELKRKGGEYSMNALVFTNSLANVLLYQGKIIESLSLAENVFTRTKEIKGEDHSQTMVALSNLADYYQSAENSEEALKIFTKLQPKFKEKFGETNEATLKTMVHLGFAQVHHGKAGQGLPLIERASKIFKQEFGTDHPSTAFATRKLAKAYYFVNRLDQSIRCFEDALKFQNKTFGPDHPRTLQTKANLGVSYASAERFDDALPMLETAYFSKTGIVFVFGSQLANVYMSLGKNQLAADLAKNHLTESRQRYPADSLFLARELSRICAAFYIPNEDYSKAEKLLRESMKIWEEHSPNDWRFFATQSRLGETLLGQEKFQAAENELIAAHLGLTKHQTTMPPIERKTIGESIENLIHLYDFWHALKPLEGFDKKAEDWKHKMEKFNSSQNQLEQNSDSGQ